MNVMCTLNVTHCHLMLNTKRSKTFLGLLITPG
jgi:hypothetical protein